MSIRITSWLLFLTFIFIGGTQRVDAADGTIRSPVPYQVVQREHFEPTRAHANNAGGPVLGDALVPIVADFPKEPNARYEYRYVTRENAFGKGINWTALRVAATDGRIQGQARIVAGGWYRLEVRQIRDDGTMTAATVEPVGVGEILLIAGQSYAEGANETPLHVEDSDGRVVAYDVKRGTWGVAHDPQPNAGPGGTIWPPLGNALLHLLRVPVGFVNVAVGGTSSRQWLPGTPLYEQLDKAGLAVGRFRAVLWQQGESDVIENTDTAKYVANLQQIRTALASSWKFEPIWLLAKSTMHPYVYNDPVREGRIRAAIDQLWSTPGFGRGPDTDILGGENRAPRTRRTHFSRAGQERAAMLWFNAVWNEINQPHDNP